MAKSNGIKSLKQAAKLLNKHSPDGESLAYINPEEARLLRASGGSGIMTVAGVPSYISIFGWDIPFTKGIDMTGTDILKKLNPYSQPENPIFNPKNRSTNKCSTKYRWRCSINLDILKSEKR